MRHSGPPGARGFAEPIAACWTVQGLAILALPGVRRETIETMPDLPLIRHSDGSTSQGRVVDSGGRTLDAVLGDITFVRVDHQTRLQIGEVEIVIESPFTLRVGGRDYSLDPGDRGGLGPLLALYPDTLDAAALGLDGALHLMFASGATITVPPDPDFESWEIVGPGSALIVCMPGTDGPLAFWD
jgi:hypothetical protein